jgi:hypothetical protein
MDGERKRGWGGRRRRSGEWEKVKGMGQVKRERERERSNTCVYGSVAGVAGVRMPSGTSACVLYLKSAVIHS